MIPHWRVNTNTFPSPSTGLCRRRMELCISSLIDAHSALAAVPVGPVELEDMQIVPQPQDDCFARLRAPTSVRAGDAVVNGTLKSAVLGAPTPIATLQLVPTRADDDAVAIILERLARHTQALVLFSPAQAAAAVPLPVTVLIQDGGVAIVVTLPIESPPRATAVLHGVTVAGLPVPLPPTPPALVGYDGPPDLSPEQTALLHSWLGCSAPARSWREVYRASRDGFDAADFHAKCDSLPRLLVLVREKDAGWLFGGFTTVGFLPAKDGKWYEDEDAFLFSLTNRAGRPEKITPVGDHNEMNYERDRCATFGSGRDLSICSRADVLQESYTRLARGNSYAVPVSESEGDGPMTREGHENWLVSEVAAFEIPA